MATTKTAEQKKAEAEKKKAAAAKKKEADAAKAQRAKEREAKRKQKEKEKAEREKAKAARIRQNGVLMPLAGSICGQAWAVFDEVSKKLKRPAKLGEVLPVAEQRGLRPGNVRTEYNQWRKFHDVPPQGRVKVDKAA